MLNVYAKERPLLCDWKFREPTDVSFIKSHKKIAEEQASFWKGMEEKLTPKIIQGGKGRGGDSSLRNAAGKNNPSAVTAKQEVAAATVSEVGGSSRSAIPRVPRQKMPDEIKRAIPKALKKVFQTQKVCSYETICQRLRDLAVATSNNPRVDSGMAQQVALAVDSYQEELKVVISEVTVDIHGSFVSKSSQDHPEYDPLRFFFFFFFWCWNIIVAFVLYVEAVMSLFFYHQGRGDQSFTWESTWSEDYES